MPNWLAVVPRCPFVYLGMAKDIWREFERYLQMEAGRRNLFCHSAEKNYAGREIDGAAQAKQAAGYEISDIKPELSESGRKGTKWRSMALMHGWKRRAEKPSRALSRTTEFAENARYSDALVVF